MDIPVVAVANLPTGNLPARQARQRLAARDVPFNDDAKLSDLLRANQRKLQDLLYAPLQKARSLRPAIEVSAPVPAVEVNVTKSPQKKTVKVDVAAVEEPTAAPIVPVVVRRVLEEYSKMESEMTQWRVSCSQRWSDLRRHVDETLAKAEQEFEERDKEATRQWTIAYKNTGLPLRPSVVGWNTKQLEQNGLYAWQPTELLLSRTLLPDMTVAPYDLDYDAEKALDDALPLAPHRRRLTYHRLAEPVSDPSRRLQTEFTRNPRYKHPPVFENETEEDLDHNPLAYVCATPIPAGQSRNVSETASAAAAQVHPDCSVRPTHLLFTDYVAHGTYNLTLVVRNLTPCSRRFRMVTPASPYFRIEPVPEASYHSAQDSGLVAPGMGFTYRVHFTPDTVADYDYGVRVVTETGAALRVPMMARRALPQITWPLVDNQKTLNCGACLPGHEVTQTWTIPNTGGAGRYIWWVYDPTNPSTTKAFRRKSMFRPSASSGDMILFSESGDCTSAEAIGFDGFDEWPPGNGTILTPVQRNKLTVQPFDIQPVWFELKAGNETPTNVNITIRYRPNHERHFETFTLSGWYEMDETERARYVVIDVQETNGDILVSTARYEIRDTLKLWLLCDNLQTEIITVTGLSQLPRVTLVDDKETQNSLGQQDAVHLLTSITSLRSVATSFMDLASLFKPQAPPAIRNHVFDVPFEPQNIFSLARRRVVFRNDSDMPLTYRWVVHENADLMKAVSAKVCTSSARNVKESDPRYIFRVVPEAGTFEPHQDCVCQVEFFPDEQRTYDFFADLVYVHQNVDIDDDYYPSSRLRLKLTGNGVPYTIKMEPPYIRLPVGLLVGSWQRKSFTITNSSVAPVAFRISSQRLPTSSFESDTRQVIKMTLNVTEGVLKPGQSCPVLAMFTGLTPGMFREQISCSVKNVRVKRNVKLPLSTTAQSTPSTALLSQSGNTTDKLSWRQRRLSSIRLASSNQLLEDKPATPQITNNNERVEITNFIKMKSTLTIEGFVEHAPLTFIETFVDFGLVVLGKNANATVRLVNHNRNAAVNWRVKVFIKDEDEMQPQRGLVHRGVFVECTPSHGTLESQGTQEIQIRLMPTKCLRFRGLLSCLLEDDMPSMALARPRIGGSSPPCTLALSAEVQSPLVALSETRIELENCYLNTPLTAVLTLRNLTYIPTNFCWFNVENEDCTATFDPLIGTLTPGGEQTILFTLTCQNRPLDGRIPGWLFGCYIEGMPDGFLGFEVVGDVEEFHAEFELIPYSDRFYKSVVAEEAEWYAFEREGFIQIPVRKSAPSTARPLSPIATSNDALTGRRVSSAQVSSTESLHRTRSQSVQPESLLATSSSSLVTARVEERRISISTADKNSTAKTSLDTLTDEPVSMRRTFERPRKMSIAEHAALVAQNKKAGVGAIPTIDFGARVSLIESRTVTLLLQNRSGIESNFEFSFKNYPLSKTYSTFETKLDYNGGSLPEVGSTGVGFTLQPSSGRLRPFETVRIRITAHNSVPGTFTDKLVCDMMPWQTQVLTVTLPVFGVPVSFIPQKCIGLSVLDSPVSFLQLACAEAVRKGFILSEEALDILETDNVTVLDPGTPAATLNALFGSHDLVQRELLNVSHQRRGLFAAAHLQFGTTACKEMNKDPLISVTRRIRLRNDTPRYLRLTWEDWTARLVPRVRRQRREVIHTAPFSVRQSVVYVAPFGECSVIMDYTPRKAGASTGLWHASVHVYQKGLADRPMPPVQTQRRIAEEDRQQQALGHWLESQNSKIDTSASANAGAVLVLCTGVTLIRDAVFCEADDLLKTRMI